MNESEKLDLILSAVQALQEDTSQLKSSVLMLHLKVDKLDSRVSALEQRMDSMEKRMDSIEQRMDSIETETGLLKMDILALQQKTEALEKGFGSMQKDIHTLHIILENDVQTSIMRIAEGHQDLDRHLRELKGRDANFEMLTLRVSVLETDMKKVKQKINF